MFGVGGGETSSEETGHAAPRRRSRASAVPVSGTAMDLKTTNRAAKNYQTYGITNLSHSQSTAFRAVLNSRCALRSNRDAPRKAQFAYRDCKRGCGFNHAVT